MGRKCILATVGLAAVVLSGCEAVVTSRLWIGHVFDIVAHWASLLAAVAVWPLAGVVAGLWVAGDRWPGEVSTARAVGAGLLMTTPIPISILWLKLGVPPSAGLIFQACFVILGVACFYTCNYLFTVRWQRPSLLGTVAPILCFLIVLTPAEI